MASAPSVAMSAAAARSPNPVLPTARLRDRTGASGTRWSASTRLAGAGGNDPLRNASWSRRSKSSFIALPPVHRVGARRGADRVPDEAGTSRCRVRPLEPLCDGLEREVRPETHDDDDALVRCQTGEAGEQCPPPRLRGRHQEQTGEPVRPVRLGRGLPRNPIRRAASASGPGISAGRASTGSAKSRMSPVQTNGGPERFSAASRRRLPQSSVNSSGSW